MEKKYMKFIRNIDFTSAVIYTVLAYPPICLYGR